jgi:hypothetical protein
MPTLEFGEDSIRRPMYFSERKLLRALRVTGCTAFILSLSIPALAQQSAKQDFMENCAPCHGADGKGNGPALDAIPGIHPTDLTLLQEQHEGVFPSQEIHASIDGRSTIPSHKRFDMPFWGTNFQEPDKEFTAESDAKVSSRIDALVKYIGSIQRK